MNATDALRAADPARQLPDHAHDGRTELLLQEILGSPAATSHGGRSPRQPTKQTPGGSSRPDWRSLLVTAVVAVLVVGLAFLAVRSAPPPGGGSPAGPAPTASPQDSSQPADSYKSSLETKALDRATFTKLLNYKDARDLPALTWTDSEPGANGGPFDIADKLIVLAASCDGGGSIAIQISGRADTTLNCDELNAVGPIDVTPAGNDGLSVAVKATSGHPRYLAKAIAVEAP